MLHTPPISSSLIGLRGSRVVWPGLEGSTAIVRPSTGKFALCARTVRAQQSTCRPQHFQGQLLSAKISHFIVQVRNKEQNSVGIVYLTTTYQMYSYMPSNFTLKAKWLLYAPLASTLPSVPQQYSYSKYAIHTILKIMSSASLNILVMKTQCVFYGVGTEIIVIWKRCPFYGVPQHGSFAPQTARICWTSSDSCSIRGHAKRNTVRNIRLEELIGDSVVIIVTN